MKKEGCVYCKSETVCLFYRSIHIPNPIWSDHHLLLIVPLLLGHLAVATGEESFEATENERGVLGRAHLLIDVVEGTRHIRRGS